MKCNCAYCSPQWRLIKAPSDKNFTFNETFVIAKLNAYLLSGCFNFTINHILNQL